MPRNISANFRDAMEASFSSEVVVWFASIEHPDLGVPILVCSDVTDYNYAGTPGPDPSPMPAGLYRGCAFQFTMLSDDDQPPRAGVIIENVDQIIGETLIALAESPTIHMRQMAKSDWDENFPRNPLATPEIEIDAPQLKLRNVKGDAMQLTADVYGYDLTTEPWPSIRSTKGRLPGLYA